ncbi:MAG: alpha/beta hydrolase [Pseudomonadota bacterium]
MNVKQHSYHPQRDFSLAADVYGDSAQPAVVLSHGGGQTRHSWRGTANQLAERGWYVVSYDHRGHGDSDWSTDGAYSLATYAADQRHVAQSLGQPPVLVGASLGGLSALLAHGEAEAPLYRAIILVDIVPQMDTRGALEIMAFMEATVSEGFATLDDAADAIAHYTGREKRVSPQGLKKNLRMAKDGRYRWHWDPAIMELRDDVTSNPERLVEATRNVGVPIMLVRGRESNVVTEEAARQFLALVPEARYVDVADAHHMVAGDRNDVFTEAVIDFMGTLS